MLKKVILIVLLVCITGSEAVFAQQKTVVNNAKAKQMLLGKHKLSLQWISWDYFGVVNITDKDGVLMLKGAQKQRNGTDYLTIDGVITQIDAKEFKFDGKIITQVSSINNGAPCNREGEMIFRITGKRKYWRLMTIDNPCEQAADYVDIFFK